MKSTSLIVIIRLGFLLFINSYIYEAIIHNFDSMKIQSSNKLITQFISIEIPWRFIFIFICFLGPVFQITAQEDAPVSEEISAEDVAKANNPLASIKTVNLHNYYYAKLNGLPDETSNTFWFRYAQPVGKFLVRASLPVSSVPTAEGVNKSGLGDLNAFAAYLAVANAKTTFGVGPLIAIPTATDELLGTGKWQAGLALIVFEVVTPQLQLGGLITWQASFAGDENRERTSLMALQPFGMFQLGKGTYLRSTGIMTFNFVNGDYAVPFGLGIGKVMKSGKLVFNLFAEPQFTVIQNGVGQPQLQFFFGLNTQF